MKKNVFNNDISSLQVLKLKTTKIVENRYEIKDNCLGKGSYGKVFICWDSKEEEIIAVKEISKELLLQKINLNNRRQNHRQFYIRSLRNQANFMEKLNHQNILKMHNHAQTDKHIYFFLQYCDQQPPKSQIWDYQTALPLFKKVVKACVYLHSFNIAHRDLKPENILISRGQPKICDFGFAVKLESQEENAWVSQFRVGTQAYMPPQVYQSQILTLKSDVWSLGITFYKILTGRFPFDYNERSKSKYKYEYTKHIWLSKDQFIPNFLKETIQKMLIYNYKERPNIEVIGSLLKM